MTRTDPAIARIRRTFRCLAAAVLAGLLLLPVSGGASSAPPSGADACRRPAGLSDAEPGDRFAPADGCSFEGALIRSNGVGVEVPAPGTGVAASAASFDGQERELFVITHIDGTVEVVEREVEGTAGGGSLAPISRAVSQGADPCTNCPTACNDGMFVKSGWALEDGLIFEWFLNESSVPTSGKINATKARAALEGAMSRLMNSKNNCGMKDNVSFEATYEGDTIVDASVTADLDCSGADGQSVVDFGALNGAAAVTCTYTMENTTGGPDFMIESDTRLRKSESWTTDPKGKGCFIDYDLEGIAAHEFGHTAGLAHVPAASGNQTMSLFGLPNCSKAYRTFGRGDIRGLRALY